METKQQHNIEVLADDLVQTRQRVLAEGRAPYPRERPILSDISDCNRQMTYGVLNWQDRPGFEPDVIARMKKGEDEEEAVKRDMVKCGYEVFRTQEYVEVYGKNSRGEKVLLCRGKIDGILGKVIGGVSMRFPFEVKSKHPNTYRRINSVKDFEFDPWLRKHYRQMQMYLYGKDFEAGIFVLTDCLGHWKVIPVYLDYGVCEQILKRLELIHSHIKNKTLPDRIPYDVRVCGKCDFMGLCLPEKKNIGLELLDLPQMAEDLERIDILKPYYDEYKYLNDYNKAKAKAFGKDFIVGGHVATVKKIHKTIHKIPDEVKEKYTETGEELRVSFEPLQQKEEGPPVNGKLPPKVDLKKLRAQRILNDRGPSHAKNKNS